MIQCVPHGMTNSTDFSVRRMIADLADDPVARHHDVHALGRAHPEPAALLGQRLDLVGPHAGRVDDDVAAHLGDRTVLGVAHPHAGHPVAFAQQRRPPGSRSAPPRRSAPRCARRSWCAGRRRRRCRSSGCRRSSELRLSPGASRSAPGSRQVLLRGNGFRAAQLVVEEDAGRHVRPLPPRAWSAGTGTAAA